jgi:deoxyribose-phosphate aldolase
MKLTEILILAQEFDQQLPQAPAVSLPESGAAIAAWIDHTLLKAEAIPAQIGQLCQEARQYHFASVCVNPVYVPMCASLLVGSDVKVCTVVGFPLGATSAEMKTVETKWAVSQGASEIDMVIPVGLLKGGNPQAVYDHVLAVCEAAHAANALVKVILEMTYLTRLEKITACLLCQAAGAEFVKTSTGFGPSGATTEDVALMRAVVGAHTGVKAAGGVRNYSDALAMIRAGATRLGTSAGLKIIQEALASERQTP